MPLFSPRQSQFTLEKQIENFFSAAKRKDELILDITTTLDQSAIEELANNLQSRLIDGGVRSIRIRSFIERTNVEAQKKLQTMVDTLFLKIVEANSQKLTSIKVSNATLCKDGDLRRALEENGFITDISATTLFQRVADTISSVTKRNRHDVDYHNLEEVGSFGLKESSRAWGSSISAIMTIAACIAGGVTYSYGLIPASVIAFFTNWPLVAGLGLAAAFMALPVLCVYLVEGVSRLRNFFTLSAYQRTVRPAVSFHSRQLSLSSQQIAQLNRLIPLVNKVAPNAKLAPLPTSNPETGLTVIETSSQNTLLFTQLLQLVAHAGTEGTITHTTTAFAETLKQIVTGCGYRSDSNNRLSVLPPISRLDGIAQPKLTTPQSLIVNSFRDFVESLNPGRNTFNYETGSTPGSRSYSGSAANEITYFDHKLAALHIATNQVLSAEVIVDEQSLTDIAIACNDNLSLGTLTLNFANEISKPMAHQIAQIIARNSPHLRTLNLRNLNGGATAYAEGSFAIIENALLLNGAITSFNDGDEEESPSTTKMLKRNRLIRAGEWLHPFNAFGVVAAASIVGTAVTGLTYVGLTNMFTLGILSTTIVGAAITLAAPLLGTLLGGLIAGLLLYALHRKIKQASCDLNQLRAERYPHNTMEVSMSAQQFQQIQTTFTNKQKLSAQLRPSYPDIQSLFDAIQEHKTNSNNKTPLELKHQGQVITKAGAKGLPAESVITAKLPAAKFTFYSTVTASQTLAVQLDNEKAPVDKEKEKFITHAQQRMAVAWDDYCLAKINGNKAAAATASYDSSNANAGQAPQTAI